MMKLNKTDFTKMLQPKIDFSSASKDIGRPSEAFNGQLEAGGPVAGSIPTKAIVNSGLNQGTTAQSKGIKNEDVVTVVLVVGVLAIAGWAAYKIINSNNNNSKKEN